VSEINLARSLLKTPSTEPMSATVNALPETKRNENYPCKNGAMPMTYQEASPVQKKSKCPPMLYTKYVARVEGRHLLKGKSGNAYDRTKVNRALL
jgi:hypothetical protein